jgi:hypothetical protein
MCRELLYGTEIKLPIGQTATRRYRRQLFGIAVRALSPATKLENGPLHELKHSEKSQLFS